MGVGGRVLNVRFRPSVTDLPCPRYGKPFPPPPGPSAQTSKKQYTPGKVSDAGKLINPRVVVVVLRINDRIDEVLLTVQFTKSRVEFVETQTAVFVHVLEPYHVGHGANVRYTVQLVPFGYLKCDCRIKKNCILYSTPERSFSTICPVCSGDLFRPADRRQPRKLRIIIRCDNSKSFGFFSLIIKGKTNCVCMVYCYNVRARLLNI